MENISYINPEIQRIFEKITPVRKFAKGDIIYYQGDTADSFYYLKKGRVRVYMTSPDGMEKTLSTASHGEFLGEAAFFDRMPRVSYAGALTNIEVAVIDRQRFIDLIQKNPGLALELLKIQAERIRQLSTQIDAMTFLQADGRIAQLLVQSIHNEKGKQVVTLTHEEIAGIVGASRVTVSKILNNLARQRIVKTGYGSITVLNISALEELCQR